MSGHPCFASLARLPDRSTMCRPASAEASNRAVGPASNPFPSGLLPSGIGMARPSSQQARDRAEVLWGATRPEWVTSAGSLERLLTGARNGVANVKADDAVGLFELGAVDRQLSDPLARRREDRVGDRRHHRRRTRPPNTPRSLRALDQMDVDQRRLAAIKNAPSSGKRCPLTRHRPGQSSGSRYYRED